MHSPFFLHRLSTHSQGHRDIITDFEPGIDKIDLSGIDAVRADSSDGIAAFFNIPVSSDGDQAFEFVGTKFFSGMAGELRYHFNSKGNTVVAGDRDGDGKADFKLELTGIHVLDVDDFIL